MNNKYLVLVKYKDNSIHTFYYDKLEEAIALYKFALGVRVSEANIYEKSQDFSEAYYIVR